MRRLCSVVLILAILCYPVRNAGVYAVHNITMEEPTAVGVILLVSGSSEFDSSPSIAVIHDGIDSILDQYDDDFSDIRLEITRVVESKQCDVSTATLYSIFQTLSTSEVPIVGLLNGGCPAMSTLVTAIESLANISTVSFSPGLSITVDNMNSVALFPHPQTTISILASLVQSNGWKRMSVITSDNGIISKNHKLLVEELEAKGVTLFDTIFALPDSNFSTIQNFTSRIIFLDVDKNDAINILCEAFRHNMMYPYYEWILHGWYDSDWIIDNTTVSCTHLELLMVINRAIVIQDYPVLDLEAKPKCISNSSSIDSQLSFVSSLSHDAVHALILALNYSLSSEEFQDQCLINRYNCLLTQSMTDVTFDGKSGPVEFDEHGNRVFESSNILQYRTEGDCVYLIPFAQAKSSTNGTYSIVLLPNETNATIWPDIVPFDGSPLEKLISISISAVIPVYVMATVGIVFALVCLTFTFIFRNRRIIRLTSPNLNYCIDVGGIILYGSLYNRMLPYGDVGMWTIACHSLVWTNVIGFMLCFAPVFAKVFRVYYIFRNPTSKKKGIKDTYLLLIVAVIMGVAFVILVIGTFTPGISPKAYIGPSFDNPSSINEYGITVNHLNVNCFTFLSYGWVGFLSLCITSVEVAAVILALKTRNIKIKPLNDYKEITIIAYVTTVGTTEAFIIATVLVGHDTLTESLLSAAFFIITTTILGLTHIPKMKSLYQDPNGEKVFDEAFGIDSGGGAKIANGQGNLMMTEGVHSALHGKLKTLNSNSTLPRTLSTVPIRHPTVPIQSRRASSIPDVNRQVLNEQLPKQHQIQLSSSVPST